VAGRSTPPAEAGLCGGRRMRRDTLHLTLAFLGEVAESRLPGSARRWRRARRAFR
jgi:2'-5' RNA ligase